MELKYQLKQMGINVVEGNYVRKRDIEKFIDISAATKAVIDFDESNISRANTLYVPVYTSSDREDRDKLYAMQFIIEQNRQKAKVLIHLYKQDNGDKNTWLFEQQVESHSVHCKMRLITLMHGGVLV